MVGSKKLSHCGVDFDTVLRWCNLINLKVIANGCLIGPGAYFKDGWNILDGTLVIISLVNVGFELLVHGGKFAFLNLASMYVSILFHA